jgi:phosphoserine aminotransferase
MGGIHRGIKGTMARTQANFTAVNEWVAKTPWAEFLADVPATRSHTSICLKIVDPWFTAKDDDARQVFVKDMTKKLEKESAAFDVASYRDAPAAFESGAGRRWRRQT